MVVVGLAALQSPLMLPAGLVLLGRWVYLDTAARGVRNPIALAIIVPVSWTFMLPFYLARRPLVVGEVRISSGHSPRPTPWGLRCSLFDTFGRLCSVWCGPSPWGTARSWHRYRS